MDELRTTRVLLEIKWDPESQEHPAGWDYPFLIEGDPFRSEGTRLVKLLSFTDTDADGEPTQV